MMSKEIILSPPPVETLFDLDRKDSLWPKYIKDNPQIRSRVKIRKDLLEALNQPPNEHFYNLRADFLKADPLHRRIILYLPFEILPHRSFGYERFNNAYMRAWRESLSTCDVAANFVDGDVLEEEFRTEPLARVVKVAHLLPYILERGFISIGEILELIERNPKSILKDSILEAFGIKIRREEKEGLSPEKISPARARWLAKKDSPREIGNRKFGVHWSEIEQEAKKLIHLGPIILYGSQLKGYGTAEDDQDYIEVSEMKNHPDWAHVLFGGAWYGEKEFIEKSYRDLLSKYLVESPKRKTWLEEMERDAIQYRLMHNGYERFFPVCKEGAFYDSGFRKMATEIFLKKVF